MQEKGVWPKRYRARERWRAVLRGTRRVWYKIATKMV